MQVHGSQADNRSKWSIQKQIIHTDGLFMQTTKGIWFKDREHMFTTKCIEKVIYSTPSQPLRLLTTLASGALAAFFSFFFSGVFFFLPGVFFFSFFFFVHVFYFFCFGGVLGPSSSSLPLQHRWYCRLRRFPCTITTR